MLVSGSDTIIDPVLLGNPNVANSEFMLGLFNLLSGRDEVIFIQNRIMGAVMLPVNFAQVIGISISLAVIFPLLVLTFGIVVWLRRRHR